MEKGDILTVAGGLVIVFVIALLVNPQSLPNLPAGGNSPGPSGGTAAPLPSPSAVAVTPVIPTTVPAPVPIPAAEASYRIRYTDKPFTYPVVRLPESLEHIGESDIRRSGQDTVTFAYMAESRGGLSQVFTVPYPVWTMDIRVYDNVTPNIASFRMALCYAANGTAIDGIELIHPGTAFKRIQTADTPLYLIISTNEIEGYRIDLQTSRQYYQEYGPLTGS